MRRGAGFTLIEMLVTLAVGATLLAIAVPAFTNTVVSNRLSVAATSLATALTQARLQAIRRNAPVQFCSNVAANNGSGALATSCGTSAGAIYVLDRAGTTTLVEGAVALPPGIVLGSGSSGIPAVQALRYDSSGIASGVGSAVPYTGLVADLSATRVSVNNRRCIYVTTGSTVSTCAVTNSTACPTSEPTSCQQP